MHECSPQEEIYGTKRFEHKKWTSDVGEAVKKENMNWHVWNGVVLQLESFS